MSTFIYNAVNVTGDRIPGQISATSRIEALQLLQQQQLLPLTLRETRSRTSRSARVKSTAVAAACSLLADQLETGVPLLRAIRVMEQQAASQPLRTALGKIAARVADGSSLADSMHEHPQIFGPLDLSIVRAGEEGGFLHDSLRRLATIRERQEDLKHRFISALAYPVLLVVVGALVVLGMLTFFVPKFEPLFQNLKATGRMPLPTVLLLGFSTFLSAWWPMITIGIGGSFAVLRILVPADKLSAWRDSFVLEVKGIGPVVRSLAIARFCRVLGTLLQNGVPMMKSLNIAGEAMGNSVMIATITEAADNIRAGKSLAGPLAKSRHFPPEVIEMLSIAEQSNRLETVLVKIADTLETRSHQRLDVLMKLFEPALMMVMAIVVGFLVIALLMPVFEGNGLG